MVLESNILLCDYDHDPAYRTATPPQPHKFPEDGVKVHGREIGVEFAYLSKTMV